MGYYVRRLRGRKKAPAWKVQFVSHRKEDLRSTNSRTPKRTWDIAKERWRSLGFHPGMDLAEAQTRARQLNAQLHIKRQEERLRKIDEADEQFRLRHDSVLPDEFVAEFESRFVRPPSISSETGGQQRIRRRFVTWRAAQKLIVAIAREPTDWFYHTHDIYDYFFHQQFSLSYVQSIIKLASLWGHFISRKVCKPFLPIPMPKGYERQRLLTAYYKRERPTRTASLSITPELLDTVKAKLNRPNFNWLFISIWFGLRPQEIDSLHMGEMCRIETLPTGRKILWVFQTKIIALPPEDRWKPIPLLFDEQHFALKIITNGNFKRPLYKTIRSHFGKGYSLYGGREGFVDLMLSRGHAMENISIWMGHSTLSRTWRSYKNKKLFHL